MNHLRNYVLNEIKKEYEEIDIKNNGNLNY